LSIAALLFLFSCSNLKYIPEGDALYTGAKVNLKAPGLKAKRKKELRQELASLTRPKPNSKILGLRVRLYLWNIAGHPKKEKSPRGLLKNKLGEPPVLLSDVDVQRNTLILKSMLENLGFFRDSVMGDTLVKNKLASAKYDVDAGPRYRYHAIAYSVDSSEIGKAIAAAAPGTLLKPKKAFSLARIKSERERIDSSIKEKGFYFFNPDFLVAKADTAVGDAAAALGDVILDVAGGEDRLVAAAALAAAQAALDAALALRQLGPYLGIHSKSFLGTRFEKSATLQTPRKSQGFRVFSKKIPAGHRPVRLVRA